MQTIETNGETIDFIKEHLEFIRENMVMRDEFIELKERVSGIEAIMATKDDLKLMATKEDLKGMATKDDLKLMATKEDLKGMATKDDLGKLRSDMMDFMDKKLFDLKGDLVVLLRGEDRKFMFLVELLAQKQIISQGDVREIARMEPFPRFAV